MWSISDFVGKKVLVDEVALVDKYKEVLSAFQNEDVHLVQSHELPCSVDILVTSRKEIARLKRRKSDDLDEPSSGPPRKKRKSSSKRGREMLEHLQIQHKRKSFGVIIKPTEMLKDSLKDIDVVYPDQIRIQEACSINHEARRMPAPKKDGVHVYITDPRGMYKIKPYHLPDGMPHLPPGHLIPHSLVGSGISPFRLRNVSLKDNEEYIKRRVSKREKKNPNKELNEFCDLCSRYVGRFSRHERSSEHLRKVREAEEANKFVEFDSMILDFNQEWIEAKRLTIEAIRQVNETAKQYGIKDKGFHYKGNNIEEFIKLLGGNDEDEDADQLSCDAVDEVSCESDHSDASVDYLEKKPELVNSTSPSSENEEGKDPREHFKVLTLARQQESENSFSWEEIRSDD